MRLHQDVDEFVNTAERQRAMAAEIAAKLVSGEALDGRSREFAAAILREWATRPIRRDGRKNSAQFCHATAAKMFAVRRADGEGVTLAADQVAEKLGVSRTAILKAIEPLKDEIEILIETYSRNRCFTART